MAMLLRVPFRAKSSVKRVIERYYILLGESNLETLCSASLGLPTPERIGRILETEHSGESSGRVDLQLVDCGGEAVMQGDY